MVMNVNSLVIRSIYCKNNLFYVKGNCNHLIIFILRIVHHFINKLKIMQKKYTIKKYSKLVAFGSFLLTICCIKYNDRLAKLYFPYICSFLKIY